MKAMFRNLWKLSLIMVLGLLLAACAGEAPSSAVTVTAAQEAIEPTPTTLPATEAPQPEPAVTNTDVPATQDEPAAATATTAPTATPEATPIACDGALTPAQQEGPFFSPGSPERSSLIEEGMPGIPVLIFGRVFDQDCNPMAGAKVDFWLADVNGEYDNSGYTLRGHVFTDEQGYYNLESIEPTEYTGRPPHIHVKVYAPSGEELLTTQIYFAGSEDSSEVRSNPGLYVDYLEADEAGRRQVLFNFVVND